MKWMRRVMKRGQPPVAAPYATTSRGFPYPLRSWPPDTAIDIQNLATALDTDVAAAYVEWVGINASTPAGGTLIKVSGPPTYKGTVGTGLTVNATTGAINVVTAGWYQISGLADISGNLPWMVAGNATAALDTRPTMWANYVEATSSGGSVVMSIAAWPLAAGTQVCAWVSSGAAAQCRSASVTVNRIATT